MNESDRIANEDFDWLYSVLGQDKGASNHSYIAQPSIAAPTFLLPVDSNKAAASALNRYSDDKSMTAKFKTFGAQDAARLGLLSRFPKLFGMEPQISLPKWALLSEIENTIGETDLVCAVTLGGRRRNRKPVLQLIRRDGTTVGFAKVGWSDLTDELVQNEAAVLRRFASALPESIKAPKVLAEILWQQHHVAVISAVTASPKAKREESTTQHLLDSISQALGTSTVAFEDVPLLNDKRLRASEAKPQIERFIKEYKGESIRLGSWHGDLTPWNTSTVDGITSVWDWEFAASDTPIGFDQLHCAFENQRRNPAISPAQAIGQTKENAAQILGGLRQNTGAIFSLYLLELLRRELMLEGQRWDNPEMHLKAELLELLN